jgi:transcriptional regulator with XRE-family HTH domain
MYNSLNEIPVSMTTNGEIFRNARQQRNLSIDEVSKRTKIGVRVIEAIESDNFQALPPAYMRSFVKTYSQFLNIPEPEISLGEAKIEARFQPQQTELASPLSMPANVFTPAYFSDQTARNKRILTIIYSTVGGLIAIAAYLILAAPKVPRKADDTILTRPLRIIAETIKPGSTLDSAGLASQVSTDSLVLEARADESVWMNVVMDKRKSEQITLEAGKTYRWSAEKLLALSLGNAGGATFTLNGRPLQKFGEKGEVVRDIRISRDAMRREVISSSNNPTIVRNIDGSLTTPNSAAPNTSPQNNSTPPSATSTAANNASTPPSTTNTGIKPDATKLDAIATTAKTDSAKPRPRTSVRKKEQPKLIAPVVPSVPPPQPQFGKIKPPTTTTNPIKNNN